MKRFKLLYHQKTSNEESLLINPKDYPSFSVGDIVEIYSPDDKSSYLLLQVSSFSNDLLQKDSISIEQSVANNFQLKQYFEVVVNVIDDLRAVSLDSIELIFKDQYLARSDMWRLKKCLVNTCVYKEKKIEFYGIRCQVFEMYIQGERVDSGVVTEDTKVVYRSASSMVYLFLQMSCEMWHFDVNGDLYFEKAIDGFLPDLFSKWKKFNCNHDVTIVLFSRTFYEANSIDEFPLYMRECLQQDYKGRFFEDFYRVAVQNERYDDWSSTVILLKKLFNKYQEAVLEYHQKPGVKIPQAVNSTSSQGNFLEVLNMSLNVFEKHYLDRSFDRTGQLSVVISPGVGVFEVDRELTIITKQRIIDNGIGSDLVCLGEQPLHAVPLFKFHNKRSTGNAVSVANDYNMPHWINLSFYSTTENSTYANFIPRVKLPMPLPETSKKLKKKNSKYSTRLRHASQPDPSFPVLFDYDEYDRGVFQLPSHTQTSRATCSLQRPSRKKATPPNHAHSLGTAHHKTSEDHTNKLTLSDPAPCSYNSHASSAAIAIPNRNCHPNVSSSSFHNSVEVEPANLRPYSRDDADPDFTPPPYRTIVGSAGSSYESQFSKLHLSCKPKALVNPFDPSHITIKLTSNRRRWTHVFPLGPTGIFMQQHHYQAIPQISAATLISLDTEKAALSSEHLSQYKNILSNLDGDGGIDTRIGIIGKREIHTSSSTVSLSGLDARSPAAGIRNNVFPQPIGPQVDRSLSWLWGATGEQEWTPALTTGVDWKSLVIPACLPITTDYFPDTRSLQNDYVISDYFLLPEDIIAENTRPRFFQSEDDAKSHRTLTTLEVYNELICQRLQQGFQIILLSKQHASYPYAQVSSSPQFAPPLVRGRQKPEQVEECLLSIGRSFHKLTLDGPRITVTHYRPKHPHREIKIHYHYRFHAPDAGTYGVSWIYFTSEKLENYSWNYLDHYICMKGEGEFELKDSLKFWRLRMLLLPGIQAATRKILEGSEHCDLYCEFSLEDKLQQREGFLKFVEVMNKIRRQSSRKPKATSTFSSRRSSLGQTMLNQLSGSSFRDRVSSNRVHDRPRTRSQSARMGVRTDPPPPINGRVSPAIEADMKLTGSSSSLESQKTDANEDSFPADVKRLNESSSHLEIIEAMKHAQDGLNFLLKSGLPSNTFISAEAVAWLIDNVEGIQCEQRAFQFCQEMVEKGIICHASGIKEMPFIYGFYLYYIVSAAAERDYYKSLLSKQECLYLYQRDWLEVELNTVLPVTPSAYSFPSAENMWNMFNKSDSELKFKSTNIQIDEGTKSGRLEWGQARYQSIFEPYEAFEVIVEWMVATGNIAAEMVQAWARKASSSGLQLVPIPSDPFALPFSDDSDPLRGPIFIPLDLTCLMDTAVQSMNENGLLHLQEKILCKFGFLPYRNPISPSPPRYVHITGSMFVMLPIHPKESRRNSRNIPAMNLQQISSPHEEYITRHFSGVKNKGFSMNSDSDTKIGFLWSWNYMITKRWKTPGTVDENFMRKVMRDFRAFCANQNNRLEEYWNCTLLSGFPNDNSILLTLES